MRESFSLIREEDRTPIILIGGGGHATVLAEMLIETGRTILMVVCPDSIDQNPILSKFEHSESDEDVFMFSPENVQLVIGVGKMQSTSLRHQLICKFSNAGYKFANVISPSALISDFASVSEGVQILPGVIINAFTHLSDHVIVNSGAIIEHDCHVSQNVHIAPGAVLCGNVIVEFDSIIGPRAVIGQGCCVGAQTLIGAGCNVVRDVDSNSKVLPSKNRISIGKLS